MKMMRLSVSAAVLATAIAATGCNQQTFDQVNATFAAAKKGATQLSNTAVPAAAIATSLGAVELVKALSSNSKSLVAAGGGNVVAGGAGNLSGGQLPGGGPQFGPSFQLAADNTHDEDVSNPGLKVKMHVTYTSTVGADGSIKSTISSFTGSSQGFDIKAGGDFNYVPGGANGGASVSASMTGTVTHDKLALSISQLTFNTSDPLPADADLGKFTFVQKDGDKILNQLDASLHVKDNKISATGSLTDSTGKKQPLNFDQDNPNGDDTTAGADASASAGADANKPAS